MYPKRKAKSDRERFLEAFKKKVGCAPEVYVRQLAVEAPDFPYGDAGVTADYPWRPYRLEVPVFRGLPHPLWGITARITMAVLEKL